MQPEPFTNLIQEHLTLIQKVARAYSTRRSDQEEIVQEAVFQLWRNRQRIDPQRPAAAWISRVALNVAISFYRRERKHRRREDRLHEQLAPDPPTSSPETEALHESIRALAPLDRALALLHLEGNDDATAAQILGITKTNAATRLSRLRTKLRDAVTARLRRSEQSP